MARKSNTNYDILDKILNDANIKEQGSGRRWEHDPNDPEGGRWVTTTESLEDLKRSVDQLERILRS